MARPIGLPERRTPARSTLAPEWALFDIARLLVTQREPDRVLEAVAVALRDLVPYDTLTIFRADRNLRVLRPALVAVAKPKERGGETG
jgi:hypothetical protein